MNVYLVLSLMFVGSNAQGILDRINAQDNVFFTGFDSSDNTDFLQFAPADPTKQSNDDKGNLDTTLLVYTRERESVQYWGLAASYEEKKVWANNARLGLLKEFDLDSGNVRTVARDLTSGLENLAFDRITKILYWTDSLDKVIRATELSYCHLTEIYRSDVLSPYALTLHPVKRKLFFSAYQTEKDLISKTELICSDLDGSNKRVLFKFPDVLRPRGITVDFSTDMLFWTDTNLFRQAVVVASDLDGIRKKQFFAKSRSYLWGIAHYKKYIYVTDIVNTTANEYEIHIRKTDGTKSYTRLSQRRPRNVAIYGPDETASTKVSNECDGSKCEHICLARGSGGFVCKCSPGYKLVAGYKCESDPLTDDYLVVADIGQKRVFQLPLVSSTSSVGDLVSAFPEKDTCVRKYAVSTIKKTGEFAWYDIEKQEIVWENKRLSFTQGVNSITTGCCNNKVYWNTKSAIYSWDGISTTETNIYALSFFSDEQIRQVVVDCKSSLLYWLQYDSFLQTASVKRSTLEGRDVERVLSGFTNSFTLTIDYESYTLHVLTALDGILYSLPLKDLSGKIPSTSPNYSGYKKTELKPYIKEKSLLFMGVVSVNGKIFIIDDVNDIIYYFVFASGASSLEKYGDNQVFFPTALDFYSSAHYNKYLRPICEPYQGPITPTTTTTTTTTTPRVPKGPDCISKYRANRAEGIDSNTALGLLIACLAEERLQE